MTLGIFPSRTAVAVHGNALSTGFAYSASTRLRCLKEIVSGYFASAVSSRGGGQQVIVEGKKNVTECLVGDSTACILFTAKGDQCAQLKTGECVLITGAKVDMYKGSMRLVAAPDASTIEPISDSKDNNMSLIEFETVIVGATPNPPRAGDQSGGAPIPDDIVNEDM